MKPIIIIAGPTAVGKTEATIALAKKLHTQIISCDSMQIYKGLDVGSAKVSPKEMQGVIHHLLDFVDPHEGYSVSDYARDARKHISNLHQNKMIPIITGGTGLYVNSLLYAMDFSQKQRDEALRLSLEEKCAKEGPQSLHQDLLKLDKAAADRIHPNNSRKLIRALEICMQKGQTANFKTDLVEETAYDPILIVLTRVRQELYDRINQRVDIMLDGGLVEEVKGLLDQGLSSDHQAMKGIGYKEVVPYIKGQCSYEDMVATLKQNTRRYAKRQLTWFRRYDKAIWINLSDFNDKSAGTHGIIDTVMTTLKQKNHVI